MISLKSLQNGHWPVFLISIISSLTNLFLPIVLVRIISPAQVGIYKIFFLYAHSITFLSLAGSPLYSVYYWIGKKENSREFIDQAWLLSFLLSLFSALTGLFFSLQISHLIALSREQTILLLLSAVTAAPGAYYGEYLIAKGKGIKGSLFNGGFEIIKAALIIILVWRTRNISIAFYSYTILFLFKLILGIFLGKRSDILSFKVDFSKLRQVWKYCAPLSVAGALGFFFERIDMILLSSQLDTTQFAYYSMGCLMVPPLYLLEMSVSKILIPQLSLSFHQRDFTRMVTNYKKAQKNIAHLMIPAVFGLIIFSKPIVEILFTSAYSESAKYLQVYALTYLTYIIPHDAFARSTGHTSWVFKLYLIITPLSIAAVSFFASLYGATGALYAAVFFMFIPKIPGLLFSAKLCGKTMTELIEWRSLTLFTALNLFLAMLSYGAKPLFIDEKMWFYVVGPLYAIIYLLSIKLTQNFKYTEALETKYEI